MEELSGVSLPPNKAIVGYNSFAHEAGIHSHGVLRNTLTYEPLQPEIVGRKRLFVLGKHTGRTAVVEKLKERRVVATDEQLSRLVDRVKSETERQGMQSVQEHVRRHRSHFANPGINDEEFWTMVKDLGILSPARSVGDKLN